MVGAGHPLKPLPSAPRAAVARVLDILSWEKLGAQRADSQISRIQTSPWRSAVSPQGRGLNQGPASGCRGLPFPLRRLLISPEEAEASTSRRFCFSLKGGRVPGGERLASEPQVPSKGLGALVTAYCVDKNLCCQNTARCKEASPAVNCL